MHSCVAGSWSVLKRSKASLGSSRSPWLVINKEVCDVVPHVAVVVEVVHRGLQRRLESVWVIFKQPQHDTPHESGKEWERVVFRLRDESFLYSQARECKEDPGQQVHVDLTIDVVVVSKHQPSSDTCSQEGVRLQSLPLKLLLHSLKPFVREDKVRQVAGVGVCGLQDGSEFVLQTATSEQKSHHQGMRSSNFDSIYGAVSEALQHR